MKKLTYTINLSADPAHVMPGVKTIICKEENLDDVLEIARSEALDEVLTEDHPDETPTQEDRLQTLEQENADLYEALNAILDTVPEEVSADAEQS